MKKGIILILCLVFTSLILLTNISAFGVKYFPTNYSTTLEKLEDYCKSNECIVNHLGSRDERKEIYIFRSFYNRQVALEFTYQTYNQGNESLELDVILPFILINSSYCLIEYNKSTGKYIKGTYKPSYGCRKKYLINVSKYEWNESLKKDLNELKRLKMIDTTDDLIEEIIRFSNNFSYLINYKPKFNEYRSMKKYCSFIYDRSDWAVVGSCGANGPMITPFPLDIDSSLFPPDDINQKIETKLENKTNEQEIETKENETNENKVECQQLDESICPKGSEVKKIVNKTSGCEIINCIRKLANGEEKEIKIMPEKAISIINEKYNGYNYNGTINEFNQTSVYIIEGKKEMWLIGILKINSKFRVYLDTDSGKIITTETPWWWKISSDLNVYNNSD